MALLGTLMLMSVVIAQPLRSRAITDAYSDVIVHSSTKAPFSVCGTDTYLFYCENVGAILTSPLSTGKGLVFSIKVHGVSPVRISLKEGQWKHSIQI